MSDAFKSKYGLSHEDARKITEIAAYLSIAMGGSVSPEDLVRFVVHRGATVNADQISGHYFGKPTS